jgi:hypothetical protein
MRIQLQIPDDLYEVYESFLAKALSGQATVEDLLVAQLERFKGVPPQDRAIVVCGRDRSRLEEILSGGTLRDSSDLVQKVQRLADIEIGEVRVNFVPGELQNIKHYATKNRIPVQTAIEQVVHGMKEQFGLYVG